MVLFSRGSTASEIGCGLGAAGEVELLEDVGEVVLRGLVAKPQDCCDLFVSLAFGHEVGDVDLAGRRAHGFPEIVLVALVLKAARRDEVALRPVIRLCPDSCRNWRLSVSTC